MRPETKLIFVLERESGEVTAATVKRTSLHPVILERVYADRDMTRTAKMNWKTRRGSPHEVLPMVGWTVDTIFTRTTFDVY